MHNFSPKGYPWVFLLGLFTLLLPFQNCAPAQVCGRDSSSKSQSECIKKSSSTDSSKSDSDTGSSPKNGSSANRGHSGVIIIGDGNGGTIGSGGSGGGNSSGGNGSNGGSGGVVIIGDGTGGGGGSNGGGLSGGSISDGALRIIEQPKAKNTLIGEDLEVRVVVGGGKSPLSYKWYKDKKIIPTDYFWTDQYMVFDAGFAANGEYYVVVTDADGASVQSSNVRVSMQDKTMGCRTGDYVTFTNSSFDGNELIPNYLNSPAGKFLVHISYDQYNILSYVNSSQSGLVQTNVSRSLAYDESAVISNCHRSLPRIHTPKRNPATGRQSDGEGYSYRGQITFKCRNNKLLFVSNTCSWSNPLNSKN